MSVKSAARNIKKDQKQLEQILDQKLGGKRACVLSGDELKGDISISGGLPRGYSQTTVINGSDGSVDTTAYYTDCSDGVCIAMEDKANNKNGNIGTARYELAKEIIQKYTDRCVNFSRDAKTAFHKAKK